MPSLSPLLFDLYVNDLELNNTGKGINIGESTICTLMYADDIVVLGDSEEDLHALVQIVNRWCEKWQMALNQSIKFKCGSLDIDIVS